MLALDLDFDRFDIPAIFEATPAQIKLAYRRAMKKTMNWLSTRINRELGKQFDLPQRVFKVRTRKRFNSNDEYGSVWIGLDPISAGNIGKPRQTQKGVVVRSHRFDGAFIAKMKNGHINVFKRATKQRFPIDNEQVKLNSGGSAEIEGHLLFYASRASNYFQRTFEHELTYTLSKAAA